MNSCGSIIKCGNRYYLIHKSLNDNIMCPSKRDVHKLAEKLGIMIYESERAKHAAKSSPTKMHGFTQSDDHHHNRHIEFAR